MPTRLKASLRAVALVTVGAALAALTACSVATAPSGDPTHFSGGGRHACTTGGSVELDGQSHTFVLTGQCGQVIVHGNGDTVKIDQAVSLDVEGKSVSVSLSNSIGSVVLNGNGIALAASSIGSVKVTGQNNSITAPAIGAVMIQGDHNVVTTHTRPSDYRASGQDDVLTVQ